MGLRFGLSALAAVAAMALGLSPAAAANESYTFAGLEWGSSPAEARQALAAQGFKVLDAVNGPRKEFVSDNAWGMYTTRDRGKRLVATGRIGGQDLNVELIFGNNEALERVIVVGPKWNGTMDHADRMRNLANALAGQLESQYGTPAERRDPFGFVDTATWQPAQDGSQAEFYVRATKGGVFFPGNETTMRLNFWNERYSGGATAVANSSRTEGDDTSMTYGPGNTSYNPAMGR